MENIVRQNPYINSIQSQPDIINVPAPQVTPQDIANSLGLNQQVQEVVQEPQQVQTNNQTSDTQVPLDELLKQANELKKEYVQDEEIKENKSNTPFEKFGEAAKWVGETVANTAKRPVDLFTGMSEAIAHPVANVVRPLKEYTQEKIQEGQDTGNWWLPIAETVRDASDIAVYKPLTGQSISDIISQSPLETVKGIGEHIHRGGTLDAYLALLPTPAGKAINKGIGKAATALDKATGEHIGNMVKTQRAKRELRSDTIDERIDMLKNTQGFKKELTSMFNEYKVTPEDFTTLVKHMEGFENLNLSQLPERLKPVYNRLAPILDSYDKLIQKYITAEPGNLQEIIQHAVRKSERTSKPLTYQFVKDQLNNSGLLELGQYVERGTGRVIKQDNLLKALSEKTGDNIGIDAITNDIAKFDLRNTDFIIPQENLEVLAQLALDGSNPARAALAKHLFESYGLASNGLLRRISHGTAKVDKSSEIATTARRAQQIKENPLATERVYGNATAEDIAAQWLEPDNMFRYAIQKVLRERLLDFWKTEYLDQGAAITVRSTIPEDIVFVTRDTLNNSMRLHNPKRFSYKEPPVDINPEELIAIDRHALKAYQQLFFPKQNWMKVTPLMRDLTSLYKNLLLLSGLYLGGNFFGGLHQLITNSNINLLKDVTNAIRTRGELVKSLGTYREMPIAGSYKFATSANSKAGKVVRTGQKVADVLGSNIIKQADALMQNSFAEASAHTVFRRLGIPFENRNLAWLQQNLSKEQFYTALNDIEKMALIYGDETLLSPEILQFMSVGNPFFRWVDQATMSSLATAKQAPIAYGYLQGAALGGLMWDENEARAKGFGISNPQSGKIYVMDSRTGNTKATETYSKPDLKSIRVRETELIPGLTAAKAITSPQRYLLNTTKYAPLAWAMNMAKAQTEYGGIKERKDWKNIQPDYQRGVRYKNGIVQDNMEIDEIGATVVKETLLPFINKTALPIYYGLQGKQSYLPYSESLFTSPEGNPKKPYGIPEVTRRLMTEYEHAAYPGVDYPITQKKEKQLTKSVKKRQTKGENERKSRQQVLDEDRERRNQ